MFKKYSNLNIFSPSIEIPELNPDTNFELNEINKLYSPNKENIVINTDNNNNLLINGNIIQNGNTYETFTEQLYTTNDLIITRNESISAIPVNDISGLKVLNYDGSSNLVFGTDKDGYFKVGEENSLQILATREDDPTINGLSFWNNTLNRFDTSTNLTYDGTDLLINSKYAVSSSTINEILVVTALPADPDENTLYLIRE
jgi:hypothetical protein